MSLRSSARALVDRMLGNDFLNSIPAKWKTVLSIVTTKVPGVPNGTLPDPIAGDVMSSSVETNRFNELEKSTTEIDSSILTDVVLEGQELDEQTGIQKPYTEHLALAGAEMGDENKVITPLNRGLSEVRDYDLDLWEQYLSAWELEYPGKVNIDMPTKLVSLTGVIEKVLGQGESDQTGSVAVAGDYSVSLDLHASAQASAAISADVSPATRQFWGNKIDCVHKHFILRSPVSSADVLARLGSVSAWPSFAPESVELKVVSQRVSIQVTADSKGSDSEHAITGGMSGSSSSSGGGIGWSEEVGHSLKIIRIPETIHDALNVGGDVTDTQPLSATATAEVESLGPASTITRTPDDDPFARITPTTIDASPGDTHWPSSGVLLYDVIADPFKLKFVQFHCILVDAGNFPS